MIWHIRFACKRGSPLPPPLFHEPMNLRCVLSHPLVRPSGSCILGARLRWRPIAQMVGFSLILDLIQPTCSCTSHDEVKAQLEVCGRKHEPSLQGPSLQSSIFCWLWAFLAWMDACLGRHKYHYAALQETSTVLAFSLCCVLFYLMQ